MRQTTIGLLAGMGPRSTAPFLELVLDECQRQYGARDDLDFPKLLISSLPAPFYPDRPTDHAALEATIREGVVELARAGVDFIAIPCNTAHIYHPRLAAAVDVPLLDMVELALDDVPPQLRALAVVAARPTIESRLYQDGLRRRGKQVVELDWQDDVDALIAATRGPRGSGAFGERWRALSDRARAAGADGLVVACLDLTAIRGAIDPTFPVVDAGHSLARGVVATWLARRAAVTGEHRRGRYHVTTDPEQLDVAAIHAYLTRSYWAEGIPRETVERSLRASLNFGLFDGRQQIGFARVVTDHATFAYLCDVYVLEEHRGQGLSKWLMEIVVAHPSLAGARRAMLATRDAHTLYLRYGFTPLGAPDRIMEIVRPEIYRR